MFKMMTIYVSSAEETRCYQPSKNIKIQCGIEGNVMKKECSGGCSGKAVRQNNSRKFRWDCNNFAIIAKISQS